MDYSFLLYAFLTAIGCVFHIVGTYFFKLDKSNEFPKIYALSILLGMIASMIRVPTNMFLGSQYSVVFMEIFYLFLLFVATTIYSKWILNENIQIHTYIIFAMIIGLFMMNTYLDQRNIKMRNIYSSI